MITSFLKPLRNLITSPQYFLKEYLHFYAYRYFLKPPSYDRYKFLNEKQTLEYLLKNKKSFIRLGEGEFSILYGFNVDLYQQKSNHLLREFFIKIIKDYNHDSPYLLGIPRLPIQKLSYFGIKKNKNLDYWYKVETFMRNRLKENCLYGDPLIFKRVLNKNIESFKIWENKSVLLIGSMVKYFKNKQLELTKRQYLLEAPDGNAFKDYEDVVKNIFRIIDSNHLKKEDMVVLISLGPAAKVIIYELSKKGLIAYDMGTYFDLRYKK